MDSRRHVDLLETNKPRQERAKRTYEAILASAAELLVEVGVERISTNLIAERAGITVPALYRYFPNKYAVLHALGCSLMDVQNRVFEQWFIERADESNPAVLLDHLEELLRATYEVTRKQTGGLEIAQALRAIGPLQELRLASHQLVASEFASLLAGMLMRPMNDRFALQARLSVNVGYDVVEMALEDGSLPTEEVLRQGAAMIALHWREFLGSEPDDPAA